MRLLIVGNGGREHALAWKLSQSEAVGEIFVAPGNAGLARLGSVVPIHQTDVVELADFAVSLRVDFTVVGPELPLTLGIVDEFSKRGLRIFGPSRSAAEIEGSKVFAKRLMERHGIPTPPFQVVGSRSEAEAVLDGGQLGWPAVIKADGLASGKGVVVAATREEADEALVRMFDQRTFGQAAEQVVLEKCLVGTEVSFHVLTDGEAVVPLASAQDYKRLADGGAGPNTGGMGTVSPTPRLTKDLQALILRDAVLPTLKGMREEGRPFRGVLYVGLMLTDDGPQVLEYNCRFGDPETQVLLTRLEGDLLPLLQAAADGHLRDAKPRWARHASCCVVMAAKGYPGKPDTGHPIAGLEEAEEVEGVTVFHAATKAQEGAVVTTGGRVLGVTATSPSLATARERAYEAVSRIRFEGSQHRTDIGADVLSYLRSSR
jgi:phosphoribosylamine--glycine ligase